MDKKLLAVIIVVVVVIAVAVPVALLAKGPTKAVNHAPVARFTASAMKVAHNKSVTFIGTDSTDKDKKDQAKLTYAWSFGDGGTASGVTTQHKFTTDGFFTVSLTVSDGKKSNTTAKQIEVYNVAPVFTSTTPAGSAVTVFEGNAQVFETAMSDENLDTLSMKWLLDNVTTSETSSKYNFTANFTMAGQYTLTAIVTDGKAQDNNTWVITVVDVNRAPIIVSTDPTADFSLNEGASRVVTATAQDLDGDNLTNTWKVDGGIKNQSTGTVAVFTYEPDFKANGTHTITVSFSDGKLEVEHIWNVIVPNINRPPIIVDYTPTADVTMIETDEASFNVNVTDHDGDPVTYNWTLDGVKVADTKLFRYVSNYTSAGPHTLTVKVSDGTLAATHLWNITVINKNRAPTAVATVDKVVALVDDILQFNGTGSTDPDNEALTYFWEFGDGTNASTVVADHPFTTDGEFKINLTVKDPDGATSVAHLWVNISEPVPKLTELFKIGPGVEEPTPMVVGDVDNDGGMEIVQGASNGTSANVSHGCIYVFNMATQAIEWVSGDIGIPTALAVANIDGDAALEIIAGIGTAAMGDGLNTSLHGKVQVIDGISHAVEASSEDIGMITSLQLVDLDGNAQMEIVVGYFYNMTIDMGTFTMYSKGGLAVYNTALTQIYNSTGWGMVMLAGVENIDADPAIELVVMTVQSAAFLGTSQLNVTVFEWTANKPVQIANITGAGAFAPNAWAIGDIDGDNNKEILLGTSSSTSGIYEGYLHAFSPLMVEKWVTPDIGGVEFVYTANVDGAGTPEVLVGVAETEDNGDYTGRLLVLDKDGALIWNTTDIGMVNLIHVGDIDNDGQMDIIVGAVTYDDGFGIVTSAVHVYNGITQAEIGIVSGMHTMDWRNFLVMDVDGNGSDDLLFADYNENDGESYIYAYGFV